jgi:ubiquinone/menaquinone biosynthesis C-methylase UbiE
MNEVEISLTAKTQENLVSAQFDPRAAAYVSSATHAQGEDLQRLAAMAAGHGEDRALDLGCGGGHVAFALAPHVKEVVAYDLAPAMLQAVAKEAARRGLTNIATRQGVVEALPFPEATFDLVATRFSAHHWHDLYAALREARRVVRPTGRAAFIDAISPGTPLLDTYLQAVELFRDPSHVRDYSAAEWTEALDRTGFRLVAASTRRLPIAYQPWIDRMMTPAVQAQAIRAVQGVMPEEVVRHFEIAPDGSFVLDVLMLEAVPR